MITHESHYLALAAAYVRGATGIADLDDAAAVARGERDGLRLHRFKRTSQLPRVRAVLGALRGLGATSLVDLGSGRERSCGRCSMPCLPWRSSRPTSSIDPDDAQTVVVAAAREQARDYLRSGTSFAWNATNLSRSLRTQLLELFRAYRARTHVVYCETSPAEQVRRNRARRQPVPRAAIARMLDRWTVPDPTEAHEVTYVVPSGPESIAWPPT